jgi:hypothetical protein
MLRHERRPFPVGETNINCCLCLVVGTKRFKISLDCKLAKVTRLFFGVDAVEACCFFFYPIL